MQIISVLVKVYEKLFSNDFQKIKQKNLETRVSFVVLSLLELGSRHAYPMQEVQAF